MIRAFRKFVEGIYLPAISFTLVIMKVNGFLNCSWFEILAGILAIYGSCIITYIMLDAIEHEKRK